jgi:hypothetical protein
LTMTDRAEALSLSPNLNGYGLSIVDQPQSGRAGEGTSS